MSKSFALTDYNVKHQKHKLTKFTEMIWDIKFVILSAILFALYIIITEKFISQFFFPSLPIKTF